jgi:hypothetical protein
MMNRRTLLLSVFALITLLANFAPGFAQNVKEPSTGVDFPGQVSVGGANAVITGTGVRKKFGFKVYAIASYIDGSKLDRSRDVYSQLLADGAAKQLTMHFVRSVDAGKIREAFAEGLQANIPSYNSSPAKKDAEAFLNLLTDMNANEQIVMRWTQGGKVELLVKGQPRGTFTNPILARGIWSIWLGGSPISGDIKTGLISNAK